MLTDKEFDERVYAGILAAFVMTGVGATLSEATILAIIDEHGFLDMTPTEIKRYGVQHAPAGVFTAEEMANAGIEPLPPL